LLNFLFALNPADSETQKLIPFNISEPTKDDTELVHKNFVGILEHFGVKIDPNIFKEPSEAILFSDEEKNLRLTVQTLPAPGLPEPVFVSYLATRPKPQA
jgi:hypothetical protein